MNHKDCLDNILYIRTLLLTLSSPADCQTPFAIGRDLAEVKIEQKWNWPYLYLAALSLEPCGICRRNFAHTMIWTNSSLRDCQMLFIIGQGFAEVKILKKWSWLCFLNRVVEYFDKIWHRYWCWQVLAQCIAKWRIVGRGFAEVFNSEKKSYILNSFFFGKKHLYTHWYWQDLAQGIAKCNFSLSEDLPRSKL